MQVVGEEGTPRSPPSLACPMIEFSGSTAHSSHPALLVWAQGQLRAPHMCPMPWCQPQPAPSCHPSQQQEFGVLSPSFSPIQRSSPQGWHCPSGHQEDTSLFPHSDSPCVRGTWDQHRQGEHRLPLHHSRGPALTQVGREGKMFSSGLFCSGVLGFSVCFLRASFSSVYATVVWHHIWRELLCSGASISP